ncbi:MAG TPA: cytochrome c biogenesis CcdA family protein [Acidimicrobiia bacterium]|nr:cytochrome c biogenesis CcdA family protein [Acidimicrobiia bacterium]
MTALLAVAFAAGMVATVNPCGFAMLPAYLGLILGDRSPDRRSALLVGILVSTGFVAVFSIAGVLLASGLRAIVSWIPWMAAVIGVGLVAVGIAELRGAHVFSRLPGVKRSSRDRSALGLIGFGASYGVASLSCTLPIFLSLVAGTATTRSLGQSLAVFTVYGLGMSLVVVVLTLALAAGRDRILKGIRPLAARLNTISGWVLIVAGIFIVWYWATVLLTGAVNLGSNRLVRFIDELTADIVGLVSAEPLLSALVVLGLGLGAWWLSQSSTAAADVSDRDEV